MSLCGCGGFRFSARLLGNWALFCIQLFFCACWVVRVGFFATIMLVWLFVVVGVCWAYYRIYMSEASIDGQSRGIANGGSTLALNGEECLAAILLLSQGPHPLYIEKSFAGFGVGFVCMCGGWLFLLGVCWVWPVLHMRLRQWRLQLCAVVEPETT